MTLKDILTTLPELLVTETSSENRRERLISSNTCLVVVDDDPTGTQTVHGISVYLDWSVDRLCEALSSDIPVFYISTNSRGLTPEEARRVSVDVGRNLKIASEKTGRRLTIASRSDSTLRGYFPLETDSLLEGLEEKVDGIIIAPAFFEAGRHTIDNIHWVDTGSECVRADQTEFARDPTFAYKAHTLPEWVEEKSEGRWKASDVKSISLNTIRRGGSDAVLDILMSASDSDPVVVNAACYEDFGIIADAISEAEGRDKKYMYRCAASIVKVVGGFSEKDLLEEKDLSVDKGLSVAGSYVGKTSRQLAALADAGITRSVELDIASFETEDGAQKEIDSCINEIDTQLKNGNSVTLHTSRSVHVADGNDFLTFGERIMSGLCAVVHSLTVRPSFVIAKGGITSLEVARTGLGIRKAYVKGQIEKGIALWDTGPESKWPGIHYVVFPGNVGTDDTLADVVKKLLG